MKHNVNDFGKDRPPHGPLKKDTRRVPTIKQVLNYRTKKKEYGQFCSYSFSHALPARYSVLHLTVFCRAVIVEK